jgi:multidrug resistance protein, MATE family
MTNIADIGREVRATLHLAVPLALAQLAQMSMSLIDTLMIGRLGPGPLAAAALGSTMFFTLMLVCVGVVMAVGPVVAQAHGAGDAATAARAVRQGLWLGTLLAVPAALVIASGGTILRVTGQDPETARQAGAYLSVLALGVLPNLWFASLRGFVESLSRPRPILFITLGAVSVNVLGNYTLIYGNFGFPALGLVGSGIATVVVLWSMFLLLASYVRLVPALKAYRVFAGLRRPDLAMFRTLLGIGWPIGVSFGVESGLFMFSTMMIGLVGTTALAAHQIALQCAAVAFMVPMGLGMAGAVRVGQAAGRGDMLAAARSGWTAIGLAVAFMCCTAVLFWTIPEHIIGLYLDLSDPASREVLRTGTTLLGIAAVFQIVDGTQVTAAGALRGLKDTRATMVIALATYWGVGLSMAYGLGFAAGQGATGVWWGFTGGLATAAIVLSLRFHVRSRRSAAGV